MFSRIRGGGYAYSVNSQAVRVKHGIGRLWTGLFLYALLFVLLVPTAQAACTDPDGVPGELMYNDTYDVFQGCTTRGWMAFHAPTTAPPSGPQGCPNIGDVCTGAYAGMIYAADFEGDKLYVAANDAPTTLTWGPTGASGLGVCDASPYSVPVCSTGQANTDYLAGHANTYPAAEYCANLVAHGYGPGDWYLPSRNEIEKIYDDLNAAGKKASSNFLNVNYWSSTELATSYSWFESFSGGTPGATSKTSVNRVRCVAR